jgi:hypothetical protein
VPQSTNRFPILATPDLKDATITLPDGIALSPGGADGLEGCTAAEIDLSGTEVNAEGVAKAAPGHCPAKAQLGSVQIETPLLPKSLEGHVYAAQPQCGGTEQPECSEAAAEEGKIFGLYVEAEGAGINIKLPGSLEVGGHGLHSTQTGLAPGQLRVRFSNNPQLPFDEFRLQLKGGARAPLANPQTCGQAQTTSDLVPWSSPATPDAMPSSAFNVDWDGEGAICPSTPFSPGFAAGAVLPMAGDFTPFTLTVSRQDREQDLGGIIVHAPPGVLGKIAEVPLCGEPQASAGTCPATSRIGTTNVAAGAGSHPLWLSGSVFLTGS